MSPFDPRDPFGFRHLVEAWAQLIEAWRRLCADERQQGRFIVFMSMVLLLAAALLMFTAQGRAILIGMGLVYLAVLLAMKPPPRTR